MRVTEMRKYIRSTLFNAQINLLYALLRFRRRRTTNGERGVEAPERAAEVGARDQPVRGVQAPRLAAVEGEPDPARPPLRRLLRLHPARRDGEGARLDAHRRGHHP